MTTQSNRNSNRILRNTIRTALALTLTLGLASVAAASQAKPRDVGMRSSGAGVAESRDNARDLRDDVRDLNQIVDLVDDWHDAYARDNQRAMASADASIMAWLQREISESANEVSEAKAEKRGDQREIVGDAISYAVATVTGHNKAARHERAELRDSRDELREDCKDVRTARIDVNRTRTIANELSKLETSFDRGVATRADYQRKSSLLMELQSMAKAELNSDRQEIREDRR